MSQHNWLGFRKTALAAAAAMVVAVPVMAQEAKKAADVEEGAPRAKEDSVRLGTITIVGSGNKLAAGQMLNEDGAKSRSTVTREATDKDLASGNPFQALALLPGVNTFNHDATGLFGGGMTVRGFGADQMGFIVNGVPVNDSGSYSVYPQEYADQENLCTQSLAQGTPDVDSPNAGATGGNITVTSCDPEDKRRFRVSQGVGDLSYTRTFMRYDTGRFFNNSAKVFVSYSHTEADKWKGNGRAKKDHLDAAFRWDINEDNVILGSVLYNRAVNNSIYSLSLSQLRANYYADYSNNFIGHAPARPGLADSDPSQSPVYWKLANNPFENAVVSMSGSFKVAPQTYVKVQPYLWYGFGNGGWSMQRLNETNGFLDNGTMTGDRDLNGDGDVLDTVSVARASVTRTMRPGITTEVNTTLGNHNLRVGVWYERASHKQTQPALLISDEGTVSTVWLNKDRVTRPDGSFYQGRDWETVSTAYQAYVSDNWSFADDRGLLSLGVRTPHTERDVHHNANETFIYNYRMKKSYSELLPQAGLRFQLDKSSQVFFNVAKNFRAPPNYAYTNSSSTTNVRYNAVTGQVELISELTPETSVMTDLGYRYQSRALSLSATVFNNAYRDRQATAFDPNTNLAANINAGRVNTRGLELEAGTGVFKGFSAYGSLTLQRSEIKNDLLVASTVTGQSANLATSGKRYVLTPDNLLGASVQWENGPFYARLKVKRTGGQYATMMNDEYVPAYWTGDVDAGYRFGNVGFANNVMLRLNISNVGNAKYRTPSGSNTNATAYTDASGRVVSAKSIFYYLGAPRFASVSLSADF